MTVQQQLRLAPPVGQAEATAAAEPCLGNAVTDRDLNSDHEPPICTPASERRRAAAVPRSVNLSPRCQPVLSKTPRRQL
jgi:hypothetical protein